MNYPPGEKPKSSLEKTSYKKKKRDPLGRSALFLSSTDVTNAEHIANIDDVRLGRKALFSNPNQPINRPEHKAPIELVCSNCNTSSYVEVIDFVKNILPVVIWIPWREYSNFMLCPNCKKRSWIKVKLTLLTNLGL